MAACVLMMVPAIHATPSPVPFMTSISPVSAVPGGADFTLTVNGSNFYAASVVNWGSTALTTTFVSSTQLTATVTAALIANGGTGWITVSNPGVAKSNVLFLPVANGSPSLQMVSQTYSTGSGPHYGATGDFNNDGNLDIAVANANSGNVSILLGNGDGTFQSQATYSTGIRLPWGVAVGDLNNDGSVDVVVGSEGGSTMSVLLGNGDGTFQAARTVSTGSGAALNPVLADVNGDGKLDIVVGCDNGKVAVLLGNGDGTFQTATLLNDTGSAPVWALTVGDINGDGTIDIVAGNNGSSTSMDIFLGNGDGTFQSATTLNTTMNFPLAPVLTDINGDGKVDIVVDSETGGTVAVFLGNGDGTFQTPTMVNVTGGPLTVAIGDMNGDGKLDIVTPNPSGGKIAVALGNGDGTFQTPQVYGSVGLNYSAFLGNFANSAGLAVVVPSYSGTNLTVLQSTATVSPAVFDFGNVGIGVPSATQAFTLTNSTASALTITGISFTGTNPADFSETDTCSSTPVASGATCTVTVTFTPGAAGSRSATLSIADNAPGAPQTVSLTGTGVVAPIVQLSSSVLAFGNQNDGTTSASQSVTVTNIGTADLTGITISITGANSAEFGETTTCGATLAQSSNCSISVTFSPATAGLKGASVQIADNAANSPQLISLTGTGVALAPVVSLSAASLSFSNQTLGTTSSAQSVTLSNTGNASLTGLAISLTGANAGDFAETTTCGSTVTAPGTCTINVTFSPSASGARSASITLTDNAGNSPQSISLTGNGTVKPDYSVSVNPSSLTIEAGQAGSASFVVTPTGGYSGTVQFSCSGLPTGASCAFQPSQVVLDGSNTAVSAQLTLNTTGSNGVLSVFAPAAQPRIPSGFAAAGLSLLVGILILVSFGSRIGRRLPMTCRVSVLALAIALLGMGIAGCGSTKPASTTTTSPLMTPAGQYAVSVIAAAGGSTDRTASLAITVTQ